MIHATAVVDKKAQIGKDVEIGPYCIVGPDVTLHAGTKLMSHVVVDGWTEIGARCTVFPFASLGTITQDLKFKGEKTLVKIGSGTTIREYVTVNGATGEGTSTVVGENCHIMAYVHIAHNCVVGNQVIIANVGTLAGCVTIEDQAIIGGLSAVHQFCRVGRMAIVGGCSKVVQDIPPFMMADGHPAVVRGINTVGMKRKGISEESQKDIKQAFKILFKSGLNTSHAVQQIRREVKAGEEMDQFLRFVETSERGISKK